MKAETEKQKLSAQELKSAVKGEDEPEEIKPVTFKEIADQYLNEQLISENIDVYNSDRSRLKRFHEFSGGGDLPFSEVNVEFLRRFEIFLKTQKKRNGNKKTPPRPLSERTRVNHLLVIRTIWNRAITAKVASQADYPFGAGSKISIKFPESAKSALTLMN